MFNVNIAFRLFSHKRVNERPNLDTVRIDCLMPFKSLKMNWSIKFPFVY